MKDNISLSIEKLPQNIEVVSERGSLGLLALGAVGLVAWRKKRAEVKALKESNKQ